MGKWNVSFKFPGLSALFGGDKEPLVKTKDSVVSSTGQKALNHSSNSSSTSPLEGRVSSTENLPELDSAEPSGGSPSFTWTFLRRIYYLFSFAWMFGGRRETSSPRQSDDAPPETVVEANKEIGSCPLTDEILEELEEPQEEISPPTSISTESTEVDLKSYSKEEIFLIFKGLSDWLSSKTLEELFPAKAEEIGPRVLNNPSCNCFMNAGFQSFFIREERLSWVKNCLNSIILDEGSGVCPFDNAKAYWGESRSLLESDWKQEVKREPGMECLRMTLGEVAGEMLILLDKWEREGLSTAEGKELRNLSLILASYQGKGMYRAFRLSENEINIGGMSLSCWRQEDAAEFMTHFIDSLHELSPGMAGFESLELQTTIVLSNGERRDEKPISVTNIFVFTDEVDLAGGFLSTYRNDFGEGEVQLETRTEITHFPGFLRMTVGLFTDDREIPPAPIKISPKKYLFNGNSPYELVIQENHYQLDSFVVHEGDSPQSGHYYTYARGVVEGVPAWIKYNDESIGPVEDAEIEALFNGGLVGVTPYDLMFSKVNPTASPVDVSILSDPLKSPAPRIEGA